MAAIGTGPRDFEYTDRDFKVVCDLIRKRVGIALTDSKRDMVYSRLTRRLRALGLSSFEGTSPTCSGSRRTTRSGSSSPTR